MIWRYSFPLICQEAPAGDDDDLDLFGEETEEEKKAAEEREAAKKASSKKKESKISCFYTVHLPGACYPPVFWQFDLFIKGGKSSVLLEVKPWDDETDMKKLEEVVRSVQMEGLLWGACTIPSFLSYHELFHLPFVSWMPKGFEA